MENEKSESGKSAFLKAMLYTASAIVLLVIGYFTAGYFFG